MYGIRTRRFVRRFVYDASFTTFRSRLGSSDEPLLDVSYHLAEVLEAYSNPRDDRVGELTRGAIKHLFAFAEEVGLTP